MAYCSIRNNLKSTCRQAASIGSARFHGENIDVTLTAGYSPVTVYCTPTHHQAGQPVHAAYSCILYPRNLVTNLCRDTCEYVKQRTVLVLVHQCPVISALLL